MTLKFELIRKIDFKEKHRELFADMLKKQGKVQGDFSKKLDRCKLACFVYIDAKLIAIGAIKPKTNSDFSKDKANLSVLSHEFEGELGYIYIYIYIKIMKARE